MIIQVTPLVCIFQNDASGCMVTQGKGGTGEEGKAKGEEEGKGTEKEKETQPKEMSKCYPKLLFF